MLRKFLSCQAHASQLNPRLKQTNKKQADSNLFDNYGCLVPMPSKSFANPLSNGIIFIRQSGKWNVTILRGMLRCSVWVWYASMQCVWVWYASMQCVGVVCFDAVCGCGIRLWYGLVRCVWDIVYDTWYAQVPWYGMEWNGVECM